MTDDGWMLLRMMLDAVIEALVRGALEEGPEPRSEKRDFEVTGRNTYKYDRELFFG